MQHPEPPLIAPTLALTVCLAALAGYVDAIAFTSLGGFFASFMSGNSTRLGVALGTQAAGDAVLAGSMVLSFVSGVMLAAVIVRARPGRFRSLILAGAAALLAASPVVGELQGGPLALLLLAVAMGMVHVMLRRVDAGEGSVHLTESLVRMGEALADALMRARETLCWLPHLLLWAGFVAGATMGTGLYFISGLRALWLAAVAVGLLAGWLSVRRLPTSTGG